MILVFFTSSSVCVVDKSETKIARQACTIIISVYYKTAAEHATAPTIYCCTIKLLEQNPNKIQDKRAERASERANEKKNEKIII